MAEVEFAGMTFKGGKIFVILTALSTLGGGLWGGFEFYKDYMDMKEIVQNIDVDSIQAENDKVILKLDESMVRVEEAIEYTRDIKSGLRDDIMGIEKQSDRVEDMVRESEDKVRTMIDNAEVRFENQRERVRVSQSGAMKELEEKLMDKIQRALDNPLAD